MVLVHNPLIVGRLKSQRAQHVPLVVYITLSHNTRLKHNNLFEVLRSVLCRVKGQNMPSLCHHSLT
jgi:hypothetical protein